jgi:hypothetical protein
VGHRWPALLEDIGRVPARLNDGVALGAIAMSSVFDRVPTLVIEALMLETPEETVAALTAIEQALRDELGEQPCSQP